MFFPHALHYRKQSPSSLPDSSSQQQQMINNEEGEGLSDSHHKHEAQVYDDLSTFMQLFKKQLSSIQEVIFIHQKQISIDVPQQRLKDVSRTVESFIRKYNRASGLQRIQSRTYQRFICRLFETISLYQLKYQSNNTPEGSFMHSTLMELETIVKENESIHDFGRLMKANRNIVEKFSSFQFAETGHSPKKKQPVMNFTSKRPILLEKMETRMIKLKEFPKAKREEGQQDHGESQEEDYDQEYAKSATVSEKKIHYLPFSHSIGSQLQKRFELYKGLDLDFPSFKSSYFSAKSNHDEFYREYLERNIFINRLMKVYNDDFLLFQKKKLFRNHRRTTSNKQPAGQSLDKDSKFTSSQILESQQSSQKDKGEKRIAFIHNQNFGQDKQQEGQPSKPCYKLNNVYLTFGKKQIKTLKNTRHYPNITPNILKNKQELQNIYFNQSLCPKKDLTITQSIDFQLSQIKAISNMKGSQRIRTSPDRQKQYQSCKHQQLNNVIKSLKEIQYPVRHPGKSKYLQLDCTSKKETSLNRVILTGSMNVKNVKLSKINEEKHKNILF